MGAVSFFNAARMAAIEAMAIVGGAVNGSGQLILTRNNGAQINAGNVVGPTGPSQWPVGSIYMSVSPTNPSAVFGGTWVAWGAGRVPVGVNAGDAEFDTVEETGGAKTHTLTAAEMPTHNHTIAHDHPTSSSVDTTSPTSGNFMRAGTTGVVVNNNLVQAATPTTSGNAGSGGAHNNLQPYITCYMWKRTA